MKFIISRPCKSSETVFFQHHPTRNVETFAYLAQWHLKRKKINGFIIFATDFIYSHDIPPLNVSAVKKKSTLGRIGKKIHFVKLSVLFETH